MSFSCPHFDVERDYCLLLEADCVAGQPGCVLRHTSVFYVPAEERLKAKAKDAPAPKARATPGRPRQTPASGTTTSGP
jgi:hypothetical protein